jgi:Tol biopolymer transport system component
VQDPKTKWDIWILPLKEGARTPVPLLQTEFNETGARFSPEGNFVAYVSDDSGRFELYVRPFSSTAAFPAAHAWPVSKEGVQPFPPFWRKDGKELWYVAPDAKIMSVEVTSRCGLAFR